MYLPAIDKSDIMPTPASRPVVTRRMLLLSRFMKACVMPSRKVGAIISNVTQRLSVKTLNKKNGKVR